MLIYFAGCMATYRLPNIAESTIKVLKHAGVDFSMLGDKEWCCGSVAIRTGHVNEARRLARHNVDVIRNKGATRVVTACAGCYRTLAVDYPKILREDLPFEVVHFPELLKELIDEGKLEFPEEERIVVTYHDPCHIGRHMGIYDAPRDALASMPDVDLQEMNKHRETASCCGAGGGVRSTNRSLAQGAAQARIQEAEETTATLLTTACPFCTFNLRESANITGNIEVLDLPEFVARKLKID